MPDVLTVSELTQQIENTLTSSPKLTSLFVSGEVSNFTVASSGNWFLDIKDENALIKCMAWKSTAASFSFRPKIGDQVLIGGSIAVYPSRGYYQIKMFSIKPEGAGDLMAQFEELKKKLAAEGLFDASHKKPIPKYPRRVGLITSRTGEVMHDVIQVGRRRNPSLDITLCNSLVQGKEAPPQLISALERMDKMDFDVIVIGRGGGSVEDLWCFNDEGLARAIYAAKTPIISSVGHEPDFTICDFVADKRASTPTEAASFVAYDAAKLSQDLDEKANRACSLMENKIAKKGLYLNVLIKELQGLSPMNKLSVSRQRLDGMKTKFDAKLMANLANTKNRLSKTQRLEQLFLHKLELTRRRFDAAAGRFVSDNPANKLIGGFGYAQGENGQALDTIEKVREAHDFELRMKDGSVKCQTID